MLKQTILSAMIALFTSSALAQAIPATIDSPVEITFYNYNLASAGLGKEATEKLIAEFMVENPMIKVIGMPTADTTGTVQTDIVAGRPVDIGQMVFSDFDFVVNNLGAKALEDIIPADELAAHFEGMSPNGLKLGAFNGKTYGLAYTFSTPVLFYNADIFREAGLDPDNPPKTWEAVKTAALQIVENTDKSGFDVGLFGSDWLYQGIVRSNGGDVLSEDRKTLMFGEPKAVEAVAMLRDLYDSGAYENNGAMGGIEAMAAGNLGMYLQTSAVQSALIAGATGNFELRASIMPGFGDALARPNNSGSALVIMSQDPAKQRATWELMKFLTSKHGYTIITSEIGYLPLRTDIVDDPDYLAGWVADHPLVEPNLEQLERLEPWEAMPGANYRQIVKTMMDAVEMSVFGGADPAATLKAAQDQAQGLVP